MGLPLFVAPVAPQLPSKASEKPSAAPRSAIRRTRTLRGSHARPHIAETRRRRILSLVADTTPSEYEVWEMHRTSPPREEELLSGAPSQERAHRMFEAGQTRLRDTVSFERRDSRSASFEIESPQMPPVPESRDYFDVEDQRQRLRNISRRLAARHSAPTPPYTEADGASLPRLGSDSPRLATLTPALSPARPPYDSWASVRADRRNMGLPVESGGGHGDNPAAGSTLSERVQAINRSSMNARRRERPTTAARLDGLGDRDRSLSPEGVSAWDTLLTSITPDPQPPSAGSSFASAPSAIAAASSNSGPNSANTSMTSMGPSEDTPALHDCDMSETASTSEDDEEDIYDLREFPRRGTRHWRSYADAVTARENRAHIADRHNSGELEGMHMIISRLVESDDIPDEWWASAGLSRNLRREPSA